MPGPVARYRHLTRPDDGLNTQVGAGIGRQALPPIGELPAGPRNHLVGVGKDLVVAELHGVPMRSLDRVPTPLNEAPAGRGNPEIHRNCGRRNGHPLHVFRPLARYLAIPDSDEGLDPEITAGVQRQALPAIGELLGGPQNSVVCLRKRFVLAELRPIPVHARHGVPAPFDEVGTGG